MFANINRSKIELELEFGHFWNKGPANLKFRLVKELKIFLKFINKRTLYDNLAAITRISWIGRKEMGRWSRIWFDELILVVEQLLCFKNHTIQTKKPNKNHTLKNKNTWAENMFSHRVELEKINGQIKIKSLSEKPINQKFKSELNNILTNGLKPKIITLEDTNIQNTRGGDTPQNNTINWDLLNNAKVSSVVEIKYNC